MIEKFGFKENLANQCIYLKKSGRKYIILVIFVHDILLTSSDMNLMHEIRSFLHKNFDMKDLGESSYVLGIEIFRNRSQSVLGLS